MDINEWVKVQLGLKNPIERKTQLFFYQNNDLEFRKLPFKNTCLAEKSGERQGRGFLHLFKLEYSFAGFGNIPSDRVILGHPRDSILDIFGVIDEEKDKIKKNSESKSPWVSRIATNACYEHISQKPGTLKQDIALWALAIAIGAEWIAIFIKLVFS